MGSLLDMLLAAETHATWINFKNQNWDITSSGQINITTDGSFIRAISTVHLAIADFVWGQADRGVIGTGVLGWLTDRRLTGLFI